MSITKIFFIALFCITSSLAAQNSIQILTEQKGVSIRSLALPSDQVIWASGSKGMIARSTNEGQSFEWKQVKGYENRDFRAMHAWDEQEAIIVAIAAPSVILKTKDGGQSWYKVYENSDTAMFLDAIRFSDSYNGVVIGDPINDTLFMLTTKDKGEHWTRMPSSYFKTPLYKGEAFFASSNSNLTFVQKEIIFVTGGLSSRIWYHGKATPLPLIQGTNSTGANSIAVSPNQQKIMIVGGDFSNHKNATNNIAGYRLLLEAKSDQKHLATKKIIFQPLQLGAPNGYKSAIEYISNKTIIVCGTSGVDITKNGGKSWEAISNASFHIVKKQPQKNGAFLAGSGGRIGYVNFQ
ncbi:MAG: hypothetical protein RIT38_334 [Bacteroidota bacterium]|jgi:photosystem II stability/assembly factor-like uncharacterized protein